MSRASPPQFSFSSGEISPMHVGRPDYDRYQTGLRACRGFVPLAEGPVTRMAGTRYVGTTYQGRKARLVPFIFAEDDTHVLELTDKRMRVWREGNLVETGGAPLEVVTPWEEADLATLRFVQSASRITVVDGKRPAQRINRLAIDNWTIEPVPFENGPFLSANIDETIKITASASSGSVTLTSTQPLWEAGHVGAFWRLEPEDEDDVPFWTGQTDIATGDQMRFDGAVYEVVGFDDAAATTGKSGVNPPSHREGRWLSQKDGPVWEYKYSQAGIVRIDTVTSPTEAMATVTVELPAGVVSSPTSYWSEGAWSDAQGYPAAVAFHEQRLVLAATNADPQTVWFSTVGDFLNFEPSTLDDGSFAYVVASTGNRVNRVQWIVSGGRTLHIGTSGGEYSARSSSSDVVIGPTNAVFRPDTSEGSANVAPLVVDGVPVFVARGNNRIHELSYNFSTDQVDAPEISRDARHLFEGVVELAWQTIPVRQVWACASGTLATICYDKRQEQLGCAMSTLAGGKLDSITVVPTANGLSEELYLCVERGGQRYIEIMQPLFGYVVIEPNIKDAWHLFSGIKYTGAATSIINGLNHLEGNDVYIWSDVGSLGPYTVKDGVINLGDTKVTSAIVGLNDANDQIETLHQTAGAADGGSQGRMNRIKALGLNWRKTAGGSMWVSTTNKRHTATSDPQEATPRPQDDFGPPELYDGFNDLAALSGWGPENTLTIKPTAAAPMTLMGVTPIIYMGDG